MCGIAGIVSLNGRPVSDGRHRVGRMIALLRHRGPDGEGVFASADGLAVIGNTLLSIVDPHRDFSVPMTTADGEAVLSFNGEIYDHEDQRTRLAGKGLRFRTRTDTEVLLQGYRLEGDAFLQRLDGFWGFAYYDSPSRHLILSRDLLGERHVFYHVTTDEIIFASEVNPILAVATSTLDLDFEAVVGAFRFRTPPPGRTIVAGVSRLLAGHNLSVDASGATGLREYRYRRLHPENWFDFFAARPSESNTVAAYEEVLHSVCSSRIPRDVHYMTSLSGGLDSAIVNLFAASGGAKRHHSLFGTSTEKPPQEGSDLDERTASRVTSEHLGTVHHEFSMIDDDCIDIYRQQCANSFDGLFCEGIVGFRQLAEQVAIHGGKVLVLADGADEFLGGYDRDRSAYLLFDQFGPAPAEPTLTGLPLAPNNGDHITGLSEGDFVNWQFVAHDPFRFRPIHGGTATEWLRRVFPTEAVVASAWSYGTIPAVYEDVVQSLDLTQRMALAYASSSLPDYFNLRLDRATSCHSVESRVPLQATALAELSIATPAWWRFGDGSTTKYLFRKIVEQHIGPRIAFRRKYGFFTPGWRHPDLAKKLAFEDLVRSSSVFGDLPFEKGARDLLLRPEEGRGRWFAYCLAATYEKLKAHDFAGVVPVREERVATRQDRHRLRPDGPPRNMGPGH